jgi:uncharacterized SAM-binding protein YcdF (DUF218 family)
MSEGFSLTKFIGSFFQVLPWIKTLRYAVGVALIGLIGLTIYRAFIMPTNQRSKKLILLLSQGAQITLDQKRQEKSGMDINPFVEGYGFAESDNRKGVGGKAGLRIDF